MSAHDAKVRANLVNAVFQQDFWSAYLAQAVVTNPSGGSITLPNVVVAGLPVGATVVRATAYFKCRTIYNSNGAVNALSGAQNIQVQKGGAGGYATGIALIDGAFSVAGSATEPGDVLMGNTDLAAKVTGNDTYNFQWTAALAALAALKFNDVQVGLRVWYRV